jgi:hypothetical protein
VTQKVQPFKSEHDDKKYLLVDTPSFIDTECLDGDVLMKLADWLLESYRDGVKISGILYLHRISDVRMEGSAMRNLRMFRELCGDDFMKKVILGTTLWDPTREVKDAAHEEELSQTEGFFKEMTEQGCSFVRVSGDRDADLELLSRFAVKSPSVMDLQKELLSGKSLAETAAASANSQELAELQIQNVFGGDDDCPSIGFALKSLSQESEPEPIEREGRPRGRLDRFYEKLAGQMDKIESNGEYLPLCLGPPNRRHQFYESMNRVSDKMYYGCLLLYLGARGRRDQFYEKLARQIDKSRSIVDLVEDPFWSHACWPQQTRRWMMAPFKQKKFGGVLACQRLRRAENPTFSQRIYSFLGALFLERRGDRMFSSASGRDDSHRPQPPPAKMSPDDDDDDGHFGFCKATDWQGPKRAYNSTTQVRADRQWSVDASTIAIWRVAIMRTCIHHARAQRPGPYSDSVESKSRGGGHHVIGDASRTARLLCA